MASTPDRTIVQGVWSDMMIGRDDLYPSLRVQGADFVTEVRKGNVPGHSISGQIARNPDVSGTFVDIWGNGASIIYPPSAIAMEIVSDNINDALGGTGAKTIQVNTFDGDYNLVTQTVNMNGTTPVTLAGTHLRPSFSKVVLSGTGLTNAGDITVRPVGGGNTFDIMLATFGLSTNTSFTVPAGKTAYPISIQVFYPKNQDGEIQSVFMIDGTNTWCIGGRIPIYQRGFLIDIKGASYPEKTDFKIQANSTNANIAVNAITEFLLVDNVIT